VPQVHGHQIQQLLDLQMMAQRPHGMMHSRH
jgi:hypothetical protein